MSNWLTGVIVLLIIIILADGFRRTYSARRNRIRVSPVLKKRPKEEIQDDIEPADTFRSELPNGGARVIGHRDPAEAPRKDKKLSAKELREVRRREDAAKRTPEQTHLNLDESVPLLMESVEHKSEQHHRASEQNDAKHERIEPTFTTDISDDVTQPRNNLQSSHRNSQASFDEEENHDEKNYAEEADAYDEEDDTYDEDEDGEDDFERDDYEDEDELENDYEADEEAENVAASATPPAEPEEVFIINIMAFRGEMFNGNDLLDAVLRCGLRYGNMDIFHRYSDTKGEGTLLFSMANMVKPGTFDLDSMDEFETPGVSLFMTLPIDADSMKSFELMVEAANSIAEALDGELKDDQRSVMTRQTIEHCRQRISDFERKKLFRRPR